MGIEKRGLWGEYVEYAVTFRVSLSPIPTITICGYVSTGCTSPTTTTTSITMMMMRMMTLALQATQRITTLCDRHQFVRNKRRKRGKERKRERGGREKLSHIKRPDAISSYQSRAECTVGPNGSRSFAYFTFICFRRLIGSIFIAFKPALLDTWHIYTALSIDMYR